MKGAGANSHSELDRHG